LNKRFSLTVKCPCGYSWICETNMKYYVNCPDCRKSVDITNTVDYPSIPRDKRQTVKIPLTEHDRIRTLYAAHTSIKSLSYLYKVCQTTILCIVNPGYYERQKANHLKWYLANQKQEDKKAHGKNKEWIIEQINKRPEFRKYHNEQIMKWQRRNPQRVKDNKNKWRARLRKVGIKPS